MPTRQKAGLPDYGVYVWFGFVGPAGLSPALRERLSATIPRIAQQPDTAGRIRRGGASVWPQHSAQIAALIRGELDKSGTVIRAALRSASLAAFSPGPQGA